MTQHRRKSRGPIGPSKTANQRRSRLFHGDSETTRKKTQLLETAKERFKQAADADEKQRQRELDDLRFYAGDQWPDDLLTQRQGQAAQGSVPPVPSRPSLVVNKVLQPVAQVLNQERGMDMGAELIPADDFESLTGAIDDSEVELREGILRRIQRAPETQDARTWAFERAAIAGRGYWGVMTRYVQGKTWDQEIYVNRIFNQSSVSLDPFHEQPDGSDAEFGFIGNYLPWDQYKAEFPTAAKGKDNAVLDEVENDEDFVALGEQCPGWFQLTNQTRICRVVDYYYITRETRKLALLADGTVEWYDDLTEAEGGKVKLVQGATDGALIPVPLKKNDDGQPELREVIQKKVKWAKLDGKQILDQGDWPGPDIPIVKVVGRELQPYDDDRRMEGIVRPMRDSGQALNYAVSRAVEKLTTSPPGDPWMMEAGQEEGFEQEHLLAATRVLPYVRYNGADANGVRFPNIPFKASQRPDIEGWFASIQMFGEFIKDTTLTPAAALGDVDAEHRSGKALKLQIEQSQRGTSNFLDNQARSIRREGQIINGLLYPIYGLRPGRLAKLMTGEGETQAVLLGQPFTTNEGGVPQPAQEGTPGAKSYTLSPDANFNIVVKVAKSFDTRREQEAATVGSLIESNPMLMGVIGDLFFKNLDGPGHKEMSDRVKATLDPRVLAVIDKDKGGVPAVNPAQLQAQVQQLTQIAQQQAQELQEAKSGIAKAQIDAQTRVQISQAEIASRERVATMNAQVEMAKLGQQLEADRADTIIDNETKRLEIAVDAQVKQHDALLRDKGSLRDTQAAMHGAERQREHEAIEADKSRQTEQDQEGA